MVGERSRAFLRVCGPICLRQSLDQCVVRAQKWADKPLLRERNGLDTPLIVSTSVFSAWELDDFVGVVAVGAKALGVRSYLSRWARLEFVSRFL